MIRMLHIAASMSPSGIGNFIMNAYRSVDRTKVQFDFVVCEHREVSFDDEIAQMGGRVFYVTRKSVNPWKNFNEIRKIVKKERYDFVFRHTDVATVALDLFAALLGGTKKRIAHSHSTSAKKIWIHKLFRPFLNAVCTERFACSQDAGKWMYGDRKKFRVIMNGIDIPQFVYQPQVCTEVRKEFGIGTDTLVLGHVGNYMPVKNHTFMIELFAKVQERHPDSKLMLVGDGALREQMEAQIGELALSDKVILTGVRHDIPKLLQAMDLFVFPSFYEGMPIALVEAQTAGLPCVISDVITEDVCVTEQIIRLPLADGADAWAEVVCGALGMNEAGVETCDTMQKLQSKRADCGKQIAEAGFDIQKLGEVYVQLAEDEA